MWVLLQVLKIEEYNIYVHFPFLRKKCGVAAWRKFLNEEGDCYVAAAFDASTNFDSDGNITISTNYKIISKIKLKFSSFSWIHSEHQRYRLQVVYRY